MALDIIARLQNYLFPLLLLLVGFYSTITTALEIVLFEKRPKNTLSISKLQDRAFNRTWGLVGPVMVKASEAEIQSIMSQAYGTVIDVGPGKGLTLKYLDRTKVTKAYGVEPNIAMHPALREEIERCKLQEIYSIIPYGIKQLPNGTIPSGSVDSIICIRTLCSVSSPRQTIKKLYDLLKPGGQLLVLEHHAVPDHKVMSIEGILQGLYNIFWPFLLGGCELNRKTGQWLKEAGEWGRIELEGKKGATGYEVVPDVMGRLVKAG